MLLYTDEQWDIEFFPIVILSESLSNKEIEKIVPILKGREVAIFRKCLRKPHTKEMDVLKELEINEWIDNSISTESLRELISMYSETSEPVISDKKSPLISMPFDQLVMSFTKNQRKCFLALYNAKGSTMTREGLCQYIWEDKPTKSNLAQLSVLVKALRRKLADKGFPADVIETVWGNGYGLKKEFYRLYRDTSRTNKTISY